MKKFEVITDIYFGENALDRLSQLDYKKVFVVADPFVVESGLVRHVTRPLEKASISYVLYTDVVADPTTEKVINGISAAVKAEPECIIAVGGGSAMDLAKSIRKIANQMDKNFNPRLIAIPTTSGTGSEVTSFSVITDSETHSKIPLASADMTPDEAILDEVLVKSVPASVTADTGMDVLTHAIEAYVSINNNEFSGALAEKSIEICGQFLYRSYMDNNDSHARRKMHIAACLAGLAFNSASLGLNHGMAHQLGAVFHIPHGRANAMLLPWVIEYNSNINIGSRSRQVYEPYVRKYCNIARLLGLNGSNEVMTIHSLANYMRFIAEEMQIPMQLREILSITKEEYESHLSEMADAALRDGCTQTNPRIPMKDEVIQIFKKLW
ncbi:MAG: iron-containing alcohol dehydrogenase [Clostridia bacterium]|jgi:alcohol dehydrogenase class IV|nr:iron-containing alcohol dehydrogenase [Clostridia bacterium]